MAEIPDALVEREHIHASGQGEDKHAQSAQPTVDRDALFEVLEETADLCIEGTPNFTMAERQVDALLASGVLIDVTQVRADADSDHAEQLRMAVEDTRHRVAEEIAAAIEACMEPPPDNPYDWDDGMWSYHTQAIEDARIAREAASSEGGSNG